eukprot:GEMP01007233.1.p1 GENE.GEMP01007233.1~~GEMP01007233.1.p1  ORF type:complete len:522 (+),score=96.61 GEMP01007233.1:40-1605(+)
MNHHARSSPPVLLSFGGEAPWGSPDQIDTRRGQSDSSARRQHGQQNSLVPDPQSGRTHDKRSGQHDQQSGRLHDQRKDRQHDHQSGRLHDQRKDRQHDLHSEQAHDASSGQDARQSGRLHDQRKDRQPGQQSRRVHDQGHERRPDRQNGQQLDQQNRSYRRIQENRDAGIIRNLQKVTKLYRVYKPEQVDYSNGGNAFLRQHVLFPVLSGLMFEALVADTPFDVFQSRFEEGFRELGQQKRDDGKTPAPERAILEGFLRPEACSILTNLVAQSAWCDIKKNSREDLDLLTAVTRMEELSERLKRMNVDEADEGLRANLQFLCLMNIAEFEHDIVRSIRSGAKRKKNLCAKHEKRYQRSVIQLVEMLETYGISGNVGVGILSLISTFETNLAKWGYVTTADHGVASRIVGIALDTAHDIDMAQYGRWYQAYRIARRQWPNVDPASASSHGVPSSEGEVLRDRVGQLLQVFLNVPSHEHMRQYNPDEYIVYQNAVTSGISANVRRALCDEERDGKNLRVGKNV